MRPYDWTGWSMPSVWQQLLDPFSPELIKQAYEDAKEEKIKNERRDFSKARIAARLRESRKRDAHMRIESGKNNIGYGA